MCSFYWPLKACEKPLNPTHFRIYILTVDLLSFVFVLLNKMIGIFIGTAILETVLLQTVSQSIFYVFRSSFSNPFFHIQVQTQDQCFHWYFSHIAHIIGPWVLTRFKSSSLQRPTEFWTNFPQCSVKKIFFCSCGFPSDLESVKVHTVEQHSRVRHTTRITSRKAAISAGIL